MPAARGVVFDAFSTLFSAPTLSCSVQVADRLHLMDPHLTKNQVEAAIQRHNFLRDRGEISTYEFWVGVLAELGFEHPPSQLVYEMVRTEMVAITQYSVPFPEMRETLLDLRRFGIPTAICSNASRLGRMLEELFELPDLVDAFVVSSDVGSTKSEDKIFLAAADAIGLTPRDCIYVDDTADYLRRASRLGFKPIQAAQGEAFDRYDEKRESPPPWPVIFRFPEILDHVRSS